MRATNKGAHVRRPRAAPSASASSSSPPASRMGGLRRPGSPNSATAATSRHSDHSDTFSKAITTAHYTLVAVVAALVYVNALDGGFAYDDR